MSTAKELTAKELTSSELNDVQGLILRGYKLPYIRYYILQICDVAAAHQFCAELAAEPTKDKDSLRITTAALWPLDPVTQRAIKPDYCLNLGITNAGLQTLIGPLFYTNVKDFSKQLFTVYDKGALDVENLKLIGDTGESAPEHWWNRDGDGWKSPDAPKSDGSDLHLQITLYTNGITNRDGYDTKLRAMIPKDGDGNDLVKIVFSQDSQPLVTGDNYIHFGYRDSISQPHVAGISSREVVGDDRPFVPYSQFAISADGDYAAHKLLVNGSFAAFRLLYQDVAAFNDFIDQKNVKHKVDVSRDLIAAKMVGRWFNGTPLVVSPDAPSETLPTDLNYFNNFNYLNHSENQKGNITTDESGLRCPYAAHTRRVNPRDDDKVKGNEDIGNEKQHAVKHRVMRRASPYGSDFTDQTKDENRGLVGLFIGADLSNQFQFIMSQWVSQGSFRSADTPNESGIDPIFGPQKSVGQDMANPDHEYLQYPTGTADNLQDENICGMSRFIRTDGSLYLFLPSITALRLISDPKTIPYIQTMLAKGLDLLNSAIKIERLIKIHE